MDNIIALILAATILVLIPGPNVALIVARSVQLGLRAGILTTLGTTTGVAVQLVLIAAGITAMVETASSALMVIKWVGAAYFIWLGVRTWRTAARIHAPSVVTPVIFAQGFVVAMSNPKTFVFNAAFLPQFVAGDGSVAEQMMLLSSVYLAVLLLGDALWALLAAYVAPWLATFLRLRNRLTGALFVGAGIGLALSRRSI